MLAEKHGEKEKKKRWWEGSSQRPTDEEEVKNWRRVMEERKSDLIGIVEAR